MTEPITKNIVIRKVVEIVISVQAQKVLASTNYSIEEFINWVSSSKSGKMGVGGTEATLFLETMYNTEEA